MQKVLRARKRFSPLIQFLISHSGFRLFRQLKQRLIWLFQKPTKRLVVFHPYQYKIVLLF